MTTGWVEVWSTKPDEGFSIEGVVALQRLDGRKLRKPRKQVAA